MSQCQYDIIYFLESHLKSRDKISSRKRLLLDNLVNLFFSQIKLFLLTDANMV